MRVAAVVAIIVVAAIAAGGNKAKPQVVAASPNPNLGRTAAPPKASAPTTITARRKHPSRPTPHARRDRAAHVVVPPSLPNATTPPTAAPGLTEFPPSSIQWTARRRSTIAHNAQTTITVVAHNPTNGTITLPHPLACAPTLSGNGMCTEMAQILAPGESATAHYKIDGARSAAG